MTVHRHYEVLKGSLVGHSGDSGFLPPRHSQRNSGQQNLGGPGLRIPHL